MDDVVIETHGLTKRYGEILAVDDLSMNVPRGHVFGLLGPNGSGKTTTMGMLLGLVKPTAGSFSLFDSSTQNLEALRRIGAIVETPSFYPYLSGRDNLAYFQGITGRGDPAELDGLLEKVDLADRADSRFRTYSLGMKQRLGLAYALLGDPEVLFLDEPTNGMDPAGMAEVRDLIRSLGTGGRTVLLSSHLLHEVEQVCDSVAILSKGKLIAQGKVADLVHSRAGDQVRLSTTDNTKAVADSVGAGLGRGRNCGRRVDRRHGSERPVNGHKRGPGTVRGLRHADGGRGHVPGAVLPRRYG